MKQGIAVGYPRVSSAGQEDSGYSLDAQVKQIEQFCKENNLELRAHFMEVESAKSVIGRPVLQAAVEHLKDDHADYLIVTNLDRFTRNLLDYEVLRREMEQSGKRVISIQQKFFTPLIEPHTEQEKYELIAARQRTATESELERHRIRIRLTTGRTEKAERGGWFGHGPWYEVDIVQGRPVINKERARVVRLIVRLRGVTQSEGNWAGHIMSYQQIADYLNGNNNLLNPDGTRGRIFPPPGMRPTLKERRTPRLISSKKWWKETVRKIFQSYEERVIKISRYSKPVA